MEQQPQSPASIGLSSRVPAACAGEALIDYLSARFRYLDRAGWQSEIAAQRVLIDGKSVRADLRLRAGATLTYLRVHVEPWADLGFTIVHQDDELIVVDKPAHLPVHGDGPFVRNTLIHRLRERLGAPALHLTHRLDRETSGICVLARTASAQRSMRLQFEQGQVEKTYRAVVRGRVDSPFVCNLPIGRARQSRIALRRAAGEAIDEPQAATTRFYPEAAGPAASLLRCEPATGRTHQIRVHLEAHGTPILGDKLYGRPDEDYLAFVARVKNSGDARVGVDGEPDRHLLHASVLRCLHPATGLAVEFTAPLPPAFGDWLQRWR
ncbi:MAG: RluA family pseudouridine synthase [Planctomycetes bacterium]|jgi:23S rRNA pseudouridine1911/1915/1917 synthase|nr:RluA family pseudouridine synthase [Planctomycetota bacterium]